MKDNLAFRWRRGCPLLSTEASSLNVSLNLRYRAAFRSFRPIYVIYGTLLAQKTLISLYHIQSLDLFCGSVIMIFTSFLSFLFIFCDINRGENHTYCAGVMGTASLTSLPETVRQ